MLDRNTLTSMFGQVHHSTERLQEPDWQTNNQQVKHRVLTSLANECDCFEMVTRVCNVHVLQ